LYHQLGGSAEKTGQIVQVYGLSGVTAISAGENHTVALKTDGTVWAWGSNTSGQLGDGTGGEYETSIISVQASSLTGVTAISAGEEHTVALKSDGTVWTWGYNKYGQLGDGTKKTRKTPVRVTGLSDVTAISAGLYHTLALKTDETVWAWGANAGGQLGDGTTTNRKIPVQVTGLNLGSTTTTSSSYKDENIDVSDSRLELFYGDDDEVTVMVTGDDDCSVEGVTVNASINMAGKGLIEISPEIAETDANGEAEFTITAREKRDNVKVIFKVEGVKDTARLFVKVRDE